ncbi:hypothetical protein NV379_01300 [Paenibacillus sp. N1-5-1-14]|uniref:hypothetical protein n=1 Tax=Paenibacillus radicibacter TaxID=2972488 RepID=UPI0021593438|nr:hypothetical protein [Paenibacillus radicibacter]MCR8641280.1 hypothetical protein [Paenibacillus radicibacter]
MNTQTLGEITLKEWLFRMKFYYSSLYIHETLSSFEDLKNKIDPQLIELYLDTNICIYLTKLYKEPSSLVSQTDNTFEELLGLLKNIETNNLLVDFSLGLEESCRELSNFEINMSKFNDMNNAIRSLFEMDYFQMLQHSKLIKFEPFIKHETRKTNSKTNSLESVSSFQRLLFVSYACLLKMYILDKKKNLKSNTQLIIEYFDFVEKEIDIFSASITMFAHYYFSGNNKIRKLIHKTKNNDEDKLHAIWNASLDLTFPALVSQKFLKDKIIPVFVTADENLWLIFDSMKMKFMITNGTEAALPPFLEVDYTRTNWTQAELQEINNFYDGIMERRKYKFVFNNFDQEELINRMRILCFNLEKELKNSL